MHANTFSNDFQTIDFDQLGDVTGAGWDFMRTIRTAVNDAGVYGTIGTLGGAAAGSVVPGVGTLAGAGGGGLIGAGVGALWGAGRDIVNQIRGDQTQPALGQ